MTAINHYGVLYEPVVLPSKSNTQNMMHLTYYDGRTVCGINMTNKWLRWGLRYNYESLEMLVGQKRLCSVCVERVQ